MDEIRPLESPWPVNKLAELLRGVRDSAPGGVTLNPVTGVHNALAALIGSMPESVESYATGTRDPFRTGQQSLIPVMDRRDAQMAMDLANVAGGANALQRAAGQAVTRAGAPVTQKLAALLDSSVFNAAPGAMAYRYRPGYALSPPGAPDGMSAAKWAARDKALGEHIMWVAEGPEGAALFEDPFEAGYYRQQGLKIREATHDEKREFFNNAGTFDGVQAAEDPNPARSHWNNLISGLREVGGTREDLLDYFKQAPQDASFARWLGSVTNPQEIEAALKPKRAR